MTRFLRSCLVIFIIVPILSGREQNTNIFDKNIRSIVENADRSEFRYIRKNPGHYTKADWQSTIDSTWGEGLPTIEKLQLFDQFWNTVDATYPSFYNLDVNWDSLRVIYRPQVEAGVSRGRFNAIMNKMCSELLDIHVSIYDVEVALDTLKPGIPIFVATGYHSIGIKELFQEDFCHFGASLSPLADSSLLVYDVVPDHPLGLQRGDIILGYDGIPWKQLYKDLLEAELPMWFAGTPIGSTKASQTHNLLTSAGENWHLFDIIDILKYGSGDTIHISTTLLENQKMELLTTAQLPIPGVPFPDIDNGHFVSWGIVDGTNIGYIYVWNWTTNGRLPYPSSSTGDAFQEACQTLINDHKINGLVIDSRYNTGGKLSEYTNGISILFNENQDVFHNYIRSDPTDHFALTRWYYYDQSQHFETDEYLFDKPIAVLTGPFSFSCGDLMPLQMRFHPMVRTFGLATNGAFGTVDRTPFEFPDNWQAYTTRSNQGLKGYPGEYLTHLELKPDEEIWFTQEDVVRGEDTVVKRAIEWILNLAYAHDINISSTYATPSVDTLDIIAIVTNPKHHDLSIQAYIVKADTFVVDSCWFYNDGRYLEDEAEDSIWVANYLPMHEENNYKIRVKTKDLVEGTSRTISNVARFTTVGPVTYDFHTITSDDTIPKPGDEINLQFTLKNESPAVTIPDVTARISSIDTFSVVSRDIDGRFGDIGPGEIRTLFFGNYGIKIDENCPENYDLEFLIDISSNGIQYWKDTFSIIVHQNETNVTNKIGGIPKDFALIQNYPNPFNPATTIQYEVPQQTNVRLTIYDILGREVKTLLNRTSQPGTFEITWDGMDEFQNSVAGGVYFCRMEAGDFVKTIKLALVR